MLLAAVSAVGLLLSPAIAAPAGKKKAPPGSKKPADQPEEQA